MNSNEDLFPETNHAIYRVLYHIEVGLREFIVATFEQNIGPRWWKQRLPSDVKDNAKNGVKMEKNVAWSTLIPHHIIYYTDFPDLKKIIIRADNWRDIFQRIFQREDVLNSTLSELEPIRNKIAHNRKATHNDLLIVEAAYQKIIAAIGEKYFLELVGKCSLAEKVPEHLSSLEKEAYTAFQFCKRFEPLENLASWESVRKCWWFDEEYLEHEIRSIKDFFKTLHEYKKLPRYRGCGHEIEKWFNVQNVNERYELAKKEFNELLKEIGVA